MTSKDVSKLYPLGETTSAQLVDALDSIQVLWHFVFQAVSNPTADLDPQILARMNVFAASSTALAAQAYAQLAFRVDEMIGQPDRYRHDDGPVTDCLDMAAALLREACDQSSTLANKLDDASRFTGCVYTNDPKDQVAQQDS